MEMSDVPKFGELAEDTRQLLRTGGIICVFGMVCAVLTLTVCGGVGIHGPSTNSGWLMLIVFIMSMPFGLMLLSLGIAKWLHQRREEARRR